MSDAEGGEETTEAIMEATYLALCEHGYSETSISDIADEFEKSKSLLYYHYENKEDLLEDFLRYLLEQIEADFDAIDGGTPKEEVLTVIGRLLPTDVDDDRIRFMRTLFEIRSQAPYHEAYRTQFARTDELIVSELVDVIERGVESGDFRAVNSRETAEFLYATAWGGAVRGITLGERDILDRTRDAIEAYVESQLLKYA